jgi:hypothetical protein
VIDHDLLKRRCLVREETCRAWVLLLEVLGYDPRICKECWRERFVYCVRDGWHALECGFPYLGHVDGTESRFDIRVFKPGCLVRQFLEVEDESIGQFGPRDSSKT